jgi:ABC-type sulfate transport system permease subunit
MSDGAWLAITYGIGLILTWLIAARFTEADADTVVAWAFAWPMVAVVLAIVTPFVLSEKLLPLMRPAPPDPTLAAIESELDRELGRP